MSVACSGRPRVARLLVACVGILSGLLGACGKNSIPPPGTPVLTLSGSNTRFAGYVVGIDSITLSGANGIYATPLITPETVDLAATANIGELVAAPAVPSGTYTSATLTLDYTSAAIWVANNGAAVSAVAQSPTGTTLSVAVITITFDPANPLVITNGQSSRLAITLDLDAFNSLSVSSSGGFVDTVQPFAVMSEAPADATPLRVRGLFVYTQSSGFVMNIRPFNDLISALGGVTVNTNAQTYYNINGTAYIGAAGLAALSVLPQDVTVAAYGTLDDVATIGITPSFTASIVLGGTSLESPLEDHLIGIVTARSADSLTVGGGLYVTALGVISYLASSTVNMGPNTLVIKDGFAVPGLSPQSVSVGQRVNVGGVSSINSSNYLTLDATAGQVLLLNTRAWGVLSSATPNSLTMDLLTLGNFTPNGFNFTGTATGGGAISPSAYAVNTGSIDENGTAPNTLLAVDGFVAPFGSAPPAFDATTITPGSATEQTLAVEWINGGATAPFTSISATGLVLNLANADLGPVHSITTGPQSLDLKTLPVNPPFTITTTGATGSLLLAVGSISLATGVSVYNSASAFATALNATFNGTNKIYRLVAIGQYNSASNTFVAAHIDVSLEET
jgi:hypothetical protein